MPRARDVISSAVRATLERIWSGELQPAALTDTTRQAVIHFYRVVGDHNPAGSAQREYVHARADYLAGVGPNPDPNLKRLRRRPRLLQGDQVRPVPQLLNAVARSESALDNSNLKKGPCVAVRSGHHVGGNPLPNPNDLGIPGREEGGRRVAGTRKIRNNRT
jgi:hypothetical protein